MSKVLSTSHLSTMYASHVLATLFPPWFCGSLGGLCFGWFQCLWWEIGNLSTVQEPGHGSQNGNIYQNVQTPIRLEVQMWDISYIYIHLFASIFKISKAGTSCFCVSTGVAYFFESSERYSIELVSSKSPCFLQRFRWGRHNHTPATETYS